MNSIKKTFSLKGKKNLYYSSHLDKNKHSKNNFKFKIMNDINMLNADNNLSGFPSDGGKSFEIKNPRKRIEFSPLQGFY